MWNRLQRRSQQLSLGSERGQALVLIALAFIGLAAFVGLTVDAGILFSYIGHLRRATDAASLAAANQFRENRDPVDLSNMAFEMLELNGLTPLGVVAKVCDLDAPTTGIWTYNDSSLCPGETNPPTGPDTPRKYVRVETQLQVNFAFLPIIGWDSTVIRANSISEAASIDVVLAIDVSESMTVDLCYDDRDNDGDGIDDECYETTGPDSEGPNLIYEDDAATCIAVTIADGPDEDKCHPFEEVREAAKQFVGRMYFPYDRVSVVTFGRLPTVHLELDGCPQPVAADALACVVTELDDIQVEVKPLVGGDPAVHCDSGGTPRGCMTTNIGDGLRQAGGRFCIDDNGNGDCDRNEMREEAVWIVILLTDGAANAASAANPPTSFDDWICPASTYPPLNTDPPWCRDTDSSPGTRHPEGDAEYDADDYARDMADFVGCPNPNLPQPVDGSCASTAPGGQGAVIFAIGLGKYVWDNPDDPTNPRAGEWLLRYAASAGDDGDPAFDPFCDPDPGTKVDCGNYYFSPTGAGLVRVFEAIASRIFTRITH
jgi:hypothetical protein